MSTAQLGAARERNVAAKLARDGWVLVMRAAASKGAADLLLAHPEHGAALVQVGSQSKTLGPADRDRLCNAAELCGALPLLVIFRPRRPLEIRLVTRDTPSRWPSWPTE
jgi:Holliday junction resolvase